MDTATTRTAIPTAQQAMVTLAALVNRENARSLGFDSPSQVASATLGVPLQELMIRLDQLRQYNSAQSPAGLLLSNERLAFPVVVSNMTRSSVTVIREGSNWAVYGFGAPNHMREMDALRRELSAREGAAPTSYFEVRVPALNVVFLGRIRGSELMLTPIASDSRFGFERGATLMGRVALGRMVDAARAHNLRPT